MEGFVPCIRTDCNYTYRAYHSDSLLPVSTAQLAFTYSGNTVCIRYTLQLRDKRVLEMFRVQNRKLRLFRKGPLGVEGYGGATCSVSTTSQVICIEQREPGVL